MEKLSKEKRNLTWYRIREKAPIRSSEDYRFVFLTIEVFEGKEKVAKVLARMYLKPVKYIYIASIVVEPKARGLSTKEKQGVGSAVVENINSILDKGANGKGLPGVLIDNIADGSDVPNKREVYYLYREKGWREFMEGKGHLLFYKKNGQELTEEERKSIKENHWDILE